MRRAAEPFEHDGSRSGTLQARLFANEHVTGNVADERPSCSLHDVNKKERKEK